MIKFTQKSGLVRIWGRKVLSGEYTLEDVPELSNLREEVAKYVAAEEAKLAEAEEATE